MTYLLCSRTSLLIALMCLTKVQRKMRTYLILIYTAKYDQNETGNSYAFVFYCVIYVTLWDIVLTFQIFPFLPITDILIIVSVDSGPASRRCNKAFYVSYVAGIFWIRSIQKRCLAVSPVLSLNVQVQLMLIFCL